MGVLRNGRTYLTRFFLMMIAVGAAMILGSALGTVCPLPWHPLAHADEGEGPAVEAAVEEETGLTAEQWADLERRLGDLPEAAGEGRDAGIVVFPMNGTIDLGLSAFLERALLDAQDARLFVVEINTFGGRVDAAVQIRDRLMETEIPTVAYIHPRAISAGALIALSCDVIIVSPGASIGAATPIQLEGGEATPVDKKFVSYLRGEFRTTAEAQGRDGKIAEAMVDSAVAVEELVTDEELLTMDDGQTLEHGIADFRADSLDDALRTLNLVEASRSKPEISWAERLVRFLTDPVVGGLLMSLGMLGLVVEIWSPGVGLPGAVGVTCLALFFFGHFMTHLAGIEEIVLIAIGAILLMLEIFVIPGFGVAGIAGIAVIALGLLLAIVGLDLSVSVQTGFIWTAVLRVLASLGVTAMAFLGFLYLFPESRLASRLVLREKIGTRTGVRGADTAEPEESSLMGLTGVAASDLRPAGIVHFDDRRVDVVTEGDYVLKGAEVKVIDVSGNRVVVRKIETKESGE